jgi:hypothetical protein
MNKWEGSEMENITNRPKQLTTAIKLWAASYCIGILLTLIYLDHLVKLYGSLESILFNILLTTFLSSWIYYKILQGKNWARFIWLAMMIFGIYFSINSFFSQPEIPIILKIQSSFSMLLNIWIFWVVFLSSCRFYFSKKEASNNPSQSDFATLNSTKLSKIKGDSPPSSKYNFEIDEQHWATALKEFDGSDRKIGLYAQCFSYTNGDENLAKVEYLRRRASELSITQQTKEKEESLKNSNDSGQSYNSPIKLTEINTPESIKKLIDKKQPSKYFNSQSPTSFEIKLYTTIGITLLIILFMLVTRFKF